MIQSKGSFAHYGRYSSDSQRETSLEDQLRQCRKWASSHGVEIPEELTFQDKAISGASTNREAFQKLTSLAFSPDCPFDGIIIDSLSRLSRDQGDMDKTLKRLKFRGIRIIAVSDGYDSQEKSAKILAATKGIVNEIYLDDLRETTKRGMDGQFLKGYSTGGKTYGYRSVKVIDPSRIDAHGDAIPIGYKWEIYEPEAIVVRKIFELFVNGESEKSIAQLLNRNNLGGKTWTGNVIYYLLQNPRYRGEIIFNRFEWYKNPDTGKRRYKERPPDQWERRQDEHLRIVDETAWDLAQDRFTQRQRLSYTKTPKKVYLLSGLLRCTHCGGPLILAGGQKYWCKNHAERGICENAMGIRRISIEAHVLKTVKEKLPLWQDEIVSAVTMVYSIQKDPTVQNQNKIEEAKRKAEYLLVTIRDGNFYGRAKEELLREYQKTWDEISQWERRQRIRTQRVKETFDHTAISRFLEVIDQPATKYDLLSGKEFLTSVVEKIEVSDLGPKMHECGLCQTKLGKVTPQHVKSHGLTMEDFYRMDPGAGFSHQARVVIHPDPEGILMNSRLYDAMVAGARIDSIINLRLKPIITIF